MIQLDTFFNDFIPGICLNFVMEKINFVHLLILLQSAHSARIIYFDIFCLWYIVCMCYSKFNLSCNPSFYDWFGGTLKDTNSTFITKNCDQL